MIWNVNPRRGLFWSPPCALTLTDSTYSTFILDIAVRDLLAECESFLLRGMKFCTIALC
jgi:hypothetical protein